jgi:hypothetical protein
LRGDVRAQGFQSGIRDCREIAGSCPASRHALAKPDFRQARQAHQPISGDFELLDAVERQPIGHRPHQAVFSAEAVWADLQPEAFLISSWRGGGMMPNFAWLTPRAVIDRAGPWNERLSLNDDGEFFCRVALASSGIVFCGDARGYYRSSAGATLSRRRDGEALTSAFDAIALSCGRLLLHHDTPAARAACATHYQRFVFDAYPEVPALVTAAERRIAQFGGSELRIGGGRLFRFLSRWFGWKLAKRCQLAWRGFKAWLAILRKEKTTVLSAPRAALEPIGPPKTE